MTEATLGAAPLTRESALAASLKGGEPLALARLRELALAAYREMPWPSSTRDEDWRRTAQIDKLDPASFSPSSASPWLPELAGPGPKSSASLFTGAPDAGVESPGLITIVFPAARAGAHFHTAINIG